MNMMQDKILNEIRKVAEENGLEFTQIAQYANTGTGMIMHEFDTVLQCVYNFQSTYAVLQWYPDDSVACMAVGFTDPSCLLSTEINYIDASKPIKRMLTWLKTTLPLRLKRCSFD